MIGGNLIEGEKIVKKLSLLLLLFASCLSVPSNVSAQTKRSRSAHKSAGNQSQSKLVGIMKKDISLNLSGCHGWIKPASMRGERQYYVLITPNAKGGETALLNIDGEDVKLIIVRDKSGWRGRAFTTLYKNYNNGSSGVTARIVLFAKKPRQPPGKITFCSATIKVTKDKRTQTVKAVNGCGC